MRLSIVLLCLIVAACLGDNEKCRVLSFSSGTEKVAYQVGALKAIIENSDPEDVQYDVVSGVSFGAFNAAIMAVHKKGDEQQALDELYSIWKNAKNIKTHQNWWFGAAQGAMFKGGLYDNTPWEKYLKKTIGSRGADRVLTLGAVDVATGEYVDLTDISTTEELADAVFASTALNVFFPPVHKFGRDWFDGAGVWPIEVIGPISRCQQLGFSEKDIIVDVLMTTSDKLAERHSDYDTTIPSLVRYVEISGFYAGLNGIERAKDGFPDVEFRHLVSPEEDNLPTDYFPLDFNQKKVDELLQRGYDDALKVMKENPEDVYKRLIHKKNEMARPTPSKEVEAFLKGQDL